MDLIPPVQAKQSPPSLFATLYLCPKLSLEQIKDGVKLNLDEQKVLGTFAKPPKIYLSLRA